MTASFKFNCATGATHSPLIITVMDPTNSLSEGFAKLSVGTPALTRVSPERDRFIDSDHKPLDAKLMKHFRLFRQLNEDPDLPELLSILTLGDKRLVTRTEEDAEELLTSNPSIKPLLQKAWKEASFKELRKLSEFFCYYAPSLRTPNYHRRCPLACGARSMYVVFRPLLLGLVTTTRL